MKPTRAAVIILGISVLLPGIRGKTISATNGNENKTPNPTSSPLPPDLSLRLFCYYNPANGHLTGIARFAFPDSSSQRTFELNLGLQVRAANSGGEQGKVTRIEDEQYRLQGSAQRTMNIYYSGELPDPRHSADEIGLPGSRKGDPVFDYFHFISRCENYYPNPGNQFATIETTIALPKPINCLASGQRVSAQETENMNVFTFSQPYGKGTSFACGEFQELSTIDSTLPVHIFGAKSFHFQRLFDPSAIDRPLRFFLDRFGPLAIEELNILFRRSWAFGGISNPGFILFDLDAGRIDFGTPAGQRFLLDNPLSLNDLKTDCLIHELAHQWWGGVVAGKTDSDLWITEGLAQYSLLSYLEATLPDSQFQSIYQRLSDGVIRYAERGPVTRGRMLLRGGGGVNAFHALVYNKAAAVFMMLRDILGEERFDSRLRDLLDRYRYQAIDTETAIDFFSAGDPRLEQFFLKWITNGGNRVLRYRIHPRGNSQEIVFTREESGGPLPIRIWWRCKGQRQSREVILEMGLERILIEGEGRITDVRIGLRHTPAILIEEN